MFTELSQEFGHAWDSRVSTAADMGAAKSSWHAQIGDLTVEQIRRALDAMPVGPGAFPPGPRAFRKLALTKPDAADPPYFQPFPARAPQTVPDAETLQRVRAMIAQAMAVSDAPEPGQPRKSLDELNAEKNRQRAALTQWAAERGMDL